MHRGNELDIRFRAGLRDVQTALSPCPVKRTKVEQEPPLGVLAVSDAEDDCVALITLHRFEVLDEERFIFRIPEEGLHLGPRLTARGKQIVNQFLLRDAERHHTQTPVRELLEVLIDQVDNKLRFLAVRVRPAVKETVAVVVVNTDPLGVSLG